MGILILAAVIVVGVAIAWLSATSKSWGPLAAQGQESFSSAGWSTPNLGLWCLVCGLAAGAGVAIIGQATFGWVSGFDPPGWLRIGTFWIFPAGVVASA